MVLVAAACGLPMLAQAQRPAGVQPEFRLEFIARDEGTMLAGLGANVPAGLYTRLGIDGAAGWARVNGSTGTAARIDASARFLLDPFRQFRFGLYGLGGVSAMYVEGDDWTPRVLLGLGLEGRLRGRTMASLEVALGGGTRVAVVLRRARMGGR